ncbi:hypothetical protein QBC41DRAFT_238232 [Cercophora samala]|uniref:Uncharacterized protein n=1 Tax=Cercophora samala TaxID=330535 RepID=A0AA39YKZ0_9PEZI|nr:hypothetical protein QBC41DRAFT_238232 [Cercophora samala]
MAASELSSQEPVGSETATAGGNEQSGYAAVSDVKPDMKEEGAATASAEEVKEGETAEGGAKESGQGAEGESQQEVDEEGKTKNKWWGGN